MASVDLDFRGADIAPEVPPNDLNYPLYARTSFSCNFLMSIMKFSYFRLIFSSSLFLSLVFSARLFLIRCFRFSLSKF